MVLFNLLGKINKNDILSKRKTKENRNSSITMNLV